MNRADEIIYASDISHLVYLVGELAEVISMLEDSKEKTKLLMSLYDYEAIHRTRTNDLLKLQRGVDKARLKYYKVIAERDQYYTNWKEAECKLNQYIDTEMSKG
jgi:hypothetical protein